MGGVMRLGSLENLGTRVAHHLTLLKFLKLPKTP